MITDIDDLTTYFEKLLKEKDERIAALEAQLKADSKKPKIDPKLKEQANAEVQVLSTIRTKLQNLKRINDDQYTCLIKYTDATTATINPRGATIEDRRKKIIDTFQNMWNVVRSEEKTFTEADFPEIIKYIGHLVKDCKKEKKNAEEVFLQTVMSF